MSKVSVEYCKDRVRSPLSFWVHRALDSEVWDSATKFDPPLPKPVIGKGFPKYQVEYRGHTLFFSSMEEIRHCIAVLSEKVLPTTYALAQKSGYPDYQHLHWLATWPGDIKSWEDRQSIVKLLERLIEKAT